MKKLIPVAIVMVVLLFGGSFFIGCSRIEAGYVGIKVNLYGSERGVQDVAEVTGFVWYNPLTTRIYEFPTFIQHKVWTADANEDSPNNEEFTVTTKDGLSVSFDVGLDYQVIPQKVPAIFSKYRKSLPQITNEFIRTKVRNAFNNLASNYAAEELVSKRNIYENEVRLRLDAEMKAEGFEINQIAIIGKVRLPKNIETAINSKIQAVQEAIRAENEKQRVIAEAAKDIEQAKGFAEATRIRADAEASANEAVSKTLSPAIIQKMFIQKWDGKLPVYGQPPTMFKQLQ